MKRKLPPAALLAALCLVLMLAIAAWLILRPRLPAPPIVSGNELPALCRNVTFENVAYVVCTIDLRIYDLRLFHDGANGKPFGSLQAFDAAMARDGKPVLLAMNAGMYHEDLSPVGLYVEGGRTLAPLNLGDGAGNFYLKPNGVFRIGKDGGASIVETSHYGATAPDTEFATQSGPLLVLNGQINSRFDANGTSRYMRNGIGLSDARTAILAISRSEVSFGSFARLFRDTLRCPDALYFDGVVSALSDGRDIIVGGTYPAGPIIAVTGRRR